MFKNISVGCFAIIGVFSTIIFLCLLSFFLYFHYSERGDLPSSEPVEKSHLADVMKACEMSVNHIEEVLHSYRSDYSLTGDHVEVHAIKTVEYSLPGSNSQHDDWTRCDQLNEHLENVFNFAISVRGPKIDWLPTQKELRNDQTFMLPWKIHYRKGFFDYVKVIFAVPNKQMIYVVIAEV